MKKYKIGIDLGGTKLLGILVDQKHNILTKKKVRIRQNITIDNLITEIVDTYYDLASNLHIESFGLSVPSSVRSNSGIAAFLPAYGSKDIPFKNLIESKVDIDVKIENDVNMATFAEHKIGAGVGMKSLYTFYPGTGIGGGYIEDSKLIRGYNGTAGEIGHMVIDINGAKCKCGSVGCLETIVSNAGFRRLLGEAISDNKSSELFGMDDFSSNDIVNAWNNDDVTVKNILTYQAEVLGIAIANVINISGVELIVIGGQIYHKLKDELIPIVKDSAKKHAIGSGMKNVDIVLNHFGAEAPALGVSMV